MYNFYLIIGAMGSGKSFFSNQLLEKYKAANWANIVYNLGKPTDFLAAKEIIFLGYQDHEKLIKDKQTKKEYKENPFLFYYQTPQGELKNWRLMSSLPPHGLIGQAVKFPRPSAYDERLFFDLLYQYASKTFIVFDDMKAALTHGLKEEFRTLFSRVRHAGRKAPTRQAGGVDVAILLHSLNDINSDLFTFVSKVVLFKTAFDPDFRRLENTHFRAQAEKATHFLRNAPQYTSVIIDTFNNKDAIVKTPEGIFFNLK